MDPPRTEQSLLQRCCVSCPLTTRGIFPDKKRRINETRLVRRRSGGYLARNGLRDQANRGANHETQQPTPATTAGRGLQPRNSQRRVLARRSLPARRSDRYSLDQSLALAVLCREG